MECLVASRERFSGHHVMERERRGITATKGIASAMREGVKIGTPLVETLDVDDVEPSVAVAVPDASVSVEVLLASSEVSPVEE